MMGARRKGAFPHPSGVAHSRAEALACPSPGGVPFLGAQSPHFIPRCDVGGTPWLRAPLLVPTAGPGLPWEHISATQDAAHITQQVTPSTTH